MYLYLRMVLRKNKITLKSFAQKLGVSEKTLQFKLDGVHDWTYGEYLRICESFPSENPQKLMEKTNG